MSAHLASLLAVSTPTLDDADHVLVLCFAWGVGRPNRPSWLPLCVRSWQLLHRKPCVSSSDRTRPSRPDHRASSLPPPRPLRICADSRHQRAGAAAGSEVIPMASDATETKQEAEMEPTGEEAPSSGKRRFHFRQQLRRLFMRAKKKPNTHSGSVTLLNVPGADDNADDRLGARAMSLDSVFQPDAASADPERPSRVLSQDNLAGRVSAFKNQLLRTLRIASPSRLIPKRRATPEGTAAASTSPAGGSSWCAPLSLDERPTFTATLDNTAAKHRMAVRPRNQRTGARPRRTADASDGGGALSPASSFGESPSLAGPGGSGQSPSEKQQPKRPALVPPGAKRAPRPQREPALREEPDETASAARSPEPPESPANDGGVAAVAALESGQSFRLPRVRVKPAPGASSPSSAAAASSSDDSEAEVATDEPATYDPIRLPRPTLRSPSDAAPAGADDGAAAADCRGKLPHRSSSEIGGRLPFATARSKSLPRGSDHLLAPAARAVACDAVDAGEVEGRGGTRQGGGGGGVSQKVAKRGRARTQRPVSAVEPMIRAASMLSEAPSGWPELAADGGDGTRPFGVKLRRTPQSQSFCRQQQQQQQQQQLQDGGRLRASSDGIKSLGTVAAVREGSEAEEAAGDSARCAGGSRTPGAADVRSNPDGSSDPSGSDDHSPTDGSPPWRSLAESKARTWSDLEQQETIAIL
ncbi:CRACD-like protein isoform X2 [Lampetra planeri]